MNNYGQYFKDGVFFYPVQEDFDNWVSLVGMDVAIFSESAFAKLLHSEDEYAGLFEKFYQQWDGYLVQDSRQRLGHFTPGDSMLAFRNALADSELASVLDRLNQAKLKEGLELLVSESHGHDSRMPETSLSMLRNAFLYVQGLPGEHGFHKAYLEKCERLFSADPGWIRHLLNIKVNTSDRQLHGDSFIQDRCWDCVRSIVQQCRFFERGYCRQFELLMADKHEHPYVKALMLNIMLMKFLETRPTISAYLDYLQYGFYLLSCYASRHERSGIDIVKSFEIACGPLRSLTTADSTYSYIKLLELSVNERDQALSASYLVEGVNKDYFLIQVHPKWRTSTSLTSDEFMRLKPRYS